jgi:hypothetical protein
MRRDMDRRQRHKREQEHPLHHSRQDSRCNAAKEKEGHFNNSRAQTRRKMGRKIQ